MLNSLQMGMTSSEYFNACIQDKSEYIINYGTKYINKRDKTPEEQEKRIKNFTGLLYASLNNSLKVFKILLQYEYNQCVIEDVIITLNDGSKIKIYKNASCLQVAHLANSMYVLQYIYQHTSNPKQFQFLINHQDDNKLTSLDYMIMSQSKEQIQLFDEYRELFITQQFFNFKNNHSFILMVLFQNKYLLKKLQNMAQQDKLFCLQMKQLTDSIKITQKLLDILNIYEIVDIQEALQQIEQYKKYYTLLSNSSKDIQLIDKSQKTNTDIQVTVEIISQ